MPVPRNGVHSISKACARACEDEDVRYAYVKATNVVEEVKRVLRRGGELPEGGPDAYVAHFLNLAGNDPALLISTHFYPSGDDEFFSTATIVAKSLYWPTGLLKRFGGIAKRPVGTFFTRVIGSLKIFQYLVSFRPDRVLCWAPSLALWSSFLAARLSRATFVYCLHNQLLRDYGPWYQRLTGAVDRAIIRHASAVIVHGPYLKQQMIEIGVNPARLREFDWSYRNFGHGTRCEFDRSEHISENSHNTVILFIGRLQKSKGVFDLLDAVDGRLRTDASLRLVYAGDGNDLEVLRRVVVEKQLTDKVSLLGRVPHDSLPALIAQSSFVVTPTQSWFPEGYCKATIEGLVMGKPVIVPNFGSFPFLVEHGKNGLLFEPDSVVDLRRKILDLLDDDALRQRLSVGAAETSAVLRSSHFNFGDAVRDAFGITQISVN